MDVQRRSAVVNACVTVLYWLYVREKEREREKRKKGEILRISLTGRQKKKFLEGQLGKETLWKCE